MCCRNAPARPVAPRGLDGLRERLDAILAISGGGGAVPRRPAALADVPVQRELRHDEDLAPDVGERQVHLALVVLEHPQADHLLGQPLGLADPSSWPTPTSNRRPGPIPDTRSPSTRDRGAGDALEQDSQLSWARRGRRRTRSRRVLHGPSDAGQVRDVGELEREPEQRDAGPSRWPRWPTGCSRGGRTAPWRRRTAAATGRAPRPRPPRRTRSACRPPTHLDQPLGLAGCSDSALGQSVRCTETPCPRVTKPMISSPGTGVQHRPSRTSTSPSPRTTTPVSTSSARLAELHRPGERDLGHVLLGACPARERASRATTDCGETWPSPTAT